MVIILIGVLSALGIGLFTRSSAFSPLLATQQLQSATLLAQQAALAGKSGSRVEIDGTTFNAKFDEAIIQSFGLGDEEFSVSSSRQTIYFNRLAVPADSDGDLIGETTDIKISKDGTEFTLCISSLGAVYQGDSAGGCS